MIGLIIITHGQMATEYLRTAELIIGPIAGCRAISVDRNCSVSDATVNLSQAIDELNADNGVLILTDMFGGTPTNIAADFLAAGRVDILTGINLPILIKAASVREQKNLVELADFLRKYGQQAILRPADLLKTRMK